ncbi:hypothetical protein [Niveispirillum sp. KHB5.9]|uniref:hypothetical protein n=1 Tax=Niveispirillum sp. KHB5.9 TaxID=3400269 RepID=UPI003A89001D
MQVVNADEDHFPHGLSSFVLKPPFQHAGGHSWLAAAPPDYDVNDKKRLASFEVFEDEQPLPLRNVMHVEIKAEGAGRYSFWTGAVCFSSLDNTDPNVNGRTYRLVQTKEEVLGIWSFSGCTVHNPVYELEKLGMAWAPARRTGHDSTPYSHTAAEHLQLLRFLRGEQAIPAAVQPLCNITFTPRPGGYELAVSELDVVLAEICSDVEMVFRGTVLNRLRVVDALVSVAGVAAKSGDERDKRWHTAAQRWYYDGFLKMKPGFAEHAQTMLELMPYQGENDALLRDILREAAPRRISKESMVADLMELRKLLGVPLGVLTHTQYYMPDGRAIAWPPKLHDELREICQENGLLLMNPSELVEQYGAETALKEDLSHWRDDFMPVIGRAVYAFATKVIAAG